MKTQFLVVGAGPFGLSSAAYAKHLGVDVTVVGKTLDFWRRNVPRGMLLRSGPDWQLDACEVRTFEAYLQNRGLTQEEVQPVPLNVFCEYVEWFRQSYSIEPDPRLVTLLRRNGKGGFTARLEDGSEWEADQVLICPGFAFFPNFPDDLVRRLPEGSFSHTCTTVNFDSFPGKRVVIVGGRQSAFEWAALIGEAGAEMVHVTFRHEKPRFGISDWSWILPMAKRLLEDLSWWRNLSDSKKEKIGHDFWATGRMILEAWLEPRVNQPNIRIYEKTNIAESVRKTDGTFDVILDNGRSLNAHHVILATGYKPDIAKVHFLDQESILNQMDKIDGFPVLDPEFQTNLRGLFVTGMCATRDFGPFFAFTVACPIAAKIIGEKVAGLWLAK